MSNKSFYLFCAAFFATSFGVATLSPLIPSIARGFNVAPLYAARLTWWYLLPYGMAALIWSPLTRMTTIKNIFQITLIGFSIANLLFAVSSNIRTAFFAQTLIGIFACSFVPLGLIIIAKTVIPSDKGRYIGILFGISYLSSFVGVLLGGFMSWRIIYVIPAGLGVLILLCSLLWMEEFDFRREGFKISYVKTLIDHQVLSLFIVIFIVSFLYHSLQQLLGVYLSQSLNLCQTLISFICSIATICSIVLQFCAGAITQKYNNVNLIRKGLILMALFCVFAVIFKIWWLMFGLMIFWGSGWALSHLGLSVYLTNLPDKVLRDASSLNSAIRFISGGLGAVAGNLLAGKFGFNANFIIVAVGLFVLAWRSGEVLRQSSPSLMGGVKGG